MLCAAVGDQAARQWAAQHRDMHLAIALVTAMIAAAGAVVAASLVRLLHLSPAAVGAVGVTAGAIVGGAGGLALAVWLLSPARRDVRGRGDA
jgi:hypothetical protein